MPHDRRFHPRRLYDQPVFARFRRYARTLAWLLGFAARLYPSRTTAIVAASASGVGLVGVAATVLVAYAQMLETDGTVAVLGWRTQARDQQFLAYVVVLAGSLLGLGASLIFWSRRETVRLAAAFQVHCVQAVAGGFGGELTDERAYLGNRQLRRALASLQGRGRQLASIALRRLLSGIPPLLILLAGVAALLFLNAPLTAMLFALVAVSLVFYYHANFGAAAASKRYEMQAPDARQAGLQLLDELQQLPSARLGPCLLPSRRHCCGCVSPQTPSHSASSPSPAPSLSATCSSPRAGPVPFISWPPTPSAAVSPGRSWSPTCWCCASRWMPSGRSFSC